MSQRQRFIRKIIYASIIAALLLPLSWLSQPETTEATGGRLAQMRSQYRLSQSQLGEIDPASETIKLATLGMRGVATNLLWEKANGYHKEEDWVNLSATLEQIARLQPNFVSVWIFQGWNLSYNISVQFDDYRDRYYWVMRGVDFLKEGNEYNAKNPQLLSKIGYTIGNKIGRADEREYYRQLFREDDDFHGDRPKSQRDNWLVGREWMLKAEDAVAEGVPLRGESPLLFYSHPVMCLINYAEALQEDGTFGEVAKDAWRKADVSWKEYSNRDLPTQLNLFARLAEMEDYAERSAKSQAELAKYAPEGIRETIMNEKIARLPEEQQALFKADPDSLTREQSLALAQLKYDLTVQHMEVADRVRGENRAKALQAAADATLADEMARNIEVDRGIVNYDFWTLRCQIEPTDEVLAARKLLHDADQAFTAAELKKAAGLYEEGLQSWRKVIDKYPQLIDQVDTVDQLGENVEHYRSVLHQLDSPFPKPFVLQDVLDQLARNRGEEPEPASKTEKDSAEASASDPTQAE